MKDAHNPSEEEIFAEALRLPTPEDRAAYDKVLGDYSTNVNQLSQDRRKAFEAARARTLEILSPQQRTEYEELLRRHEGERANRGTGRWSEDRATTRSTTTR